MSKSKSCKSKFMAVNLTTTELKGHFHILANLPIAIILVVCNLWVGTFLFIIRVCRFDPGDKLDEFWRFSSFKTQQIHNPTATNIVTCTFTTLWNYNVTLRDRVVFKANGTALETYSPCWPLSVQLLTSSKLNALVNVGKLLLSDHGGLCGGQRWW